LQTLDNVVLVYIQELYERLVEAERQRAQARGDDVREIAMMLASGKKGKLSSKLESKFNSKFDSTFHKTV
jgi:hypothetical protein